MFQAIEHAGRRTNYVPGFLADTLGQSGAITSQEIVNDLLQRGYNAPISASPSISPAYSPVLISTKPTLTRTQAIKAGVDYVLRSYGYGARCVLVGGCRLTSGRYNTIVEQARIQADGYLRAGYIPSSHGLGLLGQLPVAVNPPTLPTLPNLGPTVTIEEPTGPGMTTWDWVAIISNAAGGVANTLQAYANARAERERVGQTATLTAAQVKAIVDQALIQNPTLNRSALVSAAAGAGGQIAPQGTPVWLLPVVVGVGVVAIMSLSKGRR